MKPFRIEGDPKVATPASVSTERMSPPTLCPPKPLPTEQSDEKLASQHPHSPVIESTPVDNGKNPFRFTK